MNWLPHYILTILLIHTCHFNITVIPSGKRRLFRYQKLIQREILHTLTLVSVYPCVCAWCVHVCAWCACVCVCMCVYGVYVFVMCVDVCACVCMDVCGYVCMCVCVHMCVWMCVHI